MPNTIKLEIELEGKDAIRTLTAIDKKLKGTEATGKKAVGSINTAFSSFAGNLGAIATTKAFSVLSAGFQQGARDALDFSKAMAEINSIAPRTADETQVLAQSLITLSNEFGKDAQGQAKAFYNIVSAGITDTVKATKVLTQANKAAVAGLTDVDSATRGLLSVVNSYTDGSIDAERASDILFETIRLGRTTFPELADTIGRVASISASAGVQFSELAGTLAFVTKSGIRTDEAVVGLRGLLTSIIGPTDDAKKVAKDLGIEWNADALAGKGLRGVLNDVAKATGGNVEQIRALLPNVRAFNVAVKVAGGDLADFNSILDDTANAGAGAGATQRALEKVINSAGFQFDKLQNQLKNLPLAFLTNFEEPIADALKSINDFVSTNGVLLIVDAVNIVIDSFQDFIDIKNGFVDAVEAAGKGASDMLQRLSGDDSLDEMIEDFKELDDQLRRLRSTQIALSESGQSNENINNRVKALQKEVDKRRDHINILIEEENKETDIDAAKTSRREKQRASIDAFQKKLADSRAKQVELQKAAAEKDIQTDNENAQKKLDNDLANEATRLTAIESLQLANAENILEQRELDKLAKQVENDTNFALLQNALGKETALREIHRIEQIKSETKRVAEFKKLRAKADKENQAGIFAVQKFEDLSAKQKEANLKGSLGTIAGLQTSSNKTLFAIGKAAALAQHALSVPKAISTALASAPPPFNFALAGLVGVAMIAQGAKIAAAKPPAFANGGVVGGFTGATSGPDNVNITARTGEMFLNAPEQKTLFDIATGKDAGAGGNTFIFNNPVILDESGTDMIIDNINNRVEFGNKQLRAS